MQHQMLSSCLLGAIRTTPSFTSRNLSLADMRQDNIIVIIAPSVSLHAQPKYSTVMATRRRKYIFIGAPKKHVSLLLIVHCSYRLHLLHIHVNQFSATRSNCRMLLACSFDGLFWHLRTSVHSCMARGYSDIKRWGFADIRQGNLEVYDVFDQIPIVHVSRRITADNFVRQNPCPVSLHCSSRCGPAPDGYEDRSERCERTKHSVKYCLARGAFTVFGRLICVAESRNAPRLYHRPALYIRIKRSIIGTGRLLHYGWLWRQSPCSATTELRGAYNQRANKRSPFSQSRSLPVRDRHGHNRKMTTRKQWLKSIPGLALRHAD